MKRTNPPYVDLPNMLDDNIGRRSLHPDVTTTSPYPKSAP